MPALPRQIEKFAGNNSFAFKRVEDCYSGFPDVCDYQCVNVVTLVQRQQRDEDDGEMTGSDELLEFILGQRMFGAAGESQLAQGVHGL